jgi:hypothetical protein
MSYSPSTMGADRGHSRRAAYFCRVSLHFLYIEAFLTDGSRFFSSFNHDRRAYFITFHADTLIFLRLDLRPRLFSLPMSPPAPFLSFERFAFSARHSIAGICLSHATQAFSCLRGGALH